MVTTAPGKPSTELVMWLRGLRELSSAATSAADLQEVLGLVASTARALLGFDFCGVLTPNDAATELVITGWSGLSEEYVNRVNADHPIGLDSTSPSARAFHTGEPVHIRDITAEPGFTPWGWPAREQGYRAIVAVPLIAQDEVIGTLNGYYQPIHTFTTAEVERLGLLANHAAIAVTSARRLDELRNLNESLRAQRDLLTRSEQIHEQLFAVTLRSGGIDGVAQVLTGLIARPVLVEDAQGNVLATAGEVSGLPDAHSRAATPVDDAQSAKPIQVPTGDAAGRHCWVSTVLLAGEVVARIWFPGAPGPLDPTGERAIEHASLVISLEMFRFQTGIEVEHRLRGELLADVLAAGASVPAQVTARAARLGHDLTRTHVAIVASIAVDDDAQRTRVYRRALTAVADVARSNQPRPLAAMYRGMIVVLWPIPEPDAGTGVDQSAGQTDSIAESAAAVHRAVARVAGGSEATVAVSGAGHRTHQQGYRAARGALDIAVHAGRAGGVVTLPALGISGLLLQLDDADQLLAFADRTLGALVRYDQLHGTELMSTLRVLLQRRMNRTLAATELHVHPNTLKQRVRRIEQLAGADLGDPAALAEFSTALVVRDVATQQVSRLQE